MPFNGGPLAADGRRLRTLRGLDSARIWLRRCAEQDAERAVLWAPVGFGAGAAIYFSLKVEPGPGTVLALAFLGVIAAGFAKRADVRGLRKCVVWLCLLFVAGFLVAKARTTLVDSPRLAEEIGPVSLIGEIVVSEALGVKGARYVISPSAFGRLEPDELPKRVRVTWRGEGAVLSPGERVEMRAVLRPPPDPVAPGAYHFSRRAYFERLGGVGYALGAPKRVSDTERNGEETRGMGELIFHAAEKARTNLASRIQARLPGDAGAVSAALMTGKRLAISDETRDALRDAGLAHVLAISGLHMGLVAGSIFFAVRLGLAMLGPLALRVPAKKWAAIAALISAAGYLMLSGGTWPTRRAFIMAACAFIAMLFDRRGVSMRVVAVAALIILVLSPEGVVDVGFQMSFAAVVALVAAFEWVRERQRRPNKPQPKHGTGSRVVGYALGVSGTSIVASFATAPFSLFHFNQAAEYALLADLLAIPVMAFWIMPAGVLGTLVSPLGLDGLFWDLMGAGVNVAIWVARLVADLPGSVFHLSAAPNLTLAGVALGGLWLFLWRASWRWLGAPVMLASAGVGLAWPSADLWVDGEARNVAARLETEGGERELVVLTRRRGRFAQDVWLRRAGEGRLEGGPPVWSELANCDALACRGELRSGARLSVIMDPRAFAEDCARADVVVALVPVPRRARGDCGKLTIDRFDLRREGGWELRIRNGEAVGYSVMDSVGIRPWTNFSSSPKGR